jgi:hypothetical protein
MNHMILEESRQMSQTGTRQLGDPHIYLHGRVGLHGLAVQQLAEQGGLPTVAGTAQQNS